MQTLGNLLKTTREERGYTIDQVIHETNISRSYLENLEEELFEEFPAEAYLIGFLRTYAEYLGIDPEKAVALYKNHKLREEPAPIEALVGRKRRAFSPVILLVAFAVILLVGGGVALYPTVSAALEERSARNEQLKEENQARPAMEFTVAEAEEEFHALTGDRVTFVQGDKSLSFAVEDRDNGLQLTREGSGDDPGHFLNLGMEEFLSLFSDSPDYRLYLKDYGFTEGGGILVVQKIEQDEMIRDEADAPLDVSQIETAAPSGVPSRTVEPVLIYTTEGGERYTLDIKFRSYCLLRYQKDHDPAIEKYYKEGDTLRVEVNNRINLWLSNAGSVYAKIGGNELDLGGAGQVSAKKIQWAKNQAGQFELLMLHEY